MLNPNGKYAIIGGLNTEKFLVPKIIKILNKKLIVYGEPESYIQRPYFLENPETAELELNTTILCCGVRPTDEMLSNPLIGCIHILEFPWMILDQEKYNRFFVCPGVLPERTKATIYTQLFSKVLTFDAFQQYARSFPEGILSINGKGFDLKEINGL
jgi:hypothetical protein